MSISCLCLTLLLTLPSYPSSPWFHIIPFLAYALPYCLPSYPSSPWFHIIPFLAYALPYCLPYQVTQVHHGFTLFHFLPMPYLTAYPTKLPKFTMVSHYSISCLCLTLLLTLPSYPSSPWFHIIPFLAYALPYCLPYQVTQVHHGF